MELPGRNGNLAGGDYRYAFNGMETDPEVSADGNGKNSYTTQFRQYDPRLGRWKSVDPLAAQFPWQSPFCGMDNNPIALNDPLGLSTGNGDGGSPDEVPSSVKKDYEEWDKENPEYLPKYKSKGKGSYQNPTQD